ncbi:heme utilization cystosolic carrier protein HutX [Vannielia litorea]|uniref:heme utilization cystosolic carrier protein HutX n=1 Tax=Vannielia litorea TaxID=1217970 RepID=UPI001C9819E8|nr:heme utilization cystosolic carrier protein HutX [Vannielia litorea]MBY6049789.1 heme utilization cystosolic carrier protein HutX [Vannielia litorea]MBY6077203.1 heme utilization cystosolic carrier protein HutX [Vannielia litorea]
MPHTTLAAAFAEKPMAPLEDIARMAGTSVAEVLHNLPGGEATCIAGTHFIEVMQEMRSWGEVTFIVNTGDVVLEVKAPIPDGSEGRGYYNLSGKPLHGHLKIDACETIAFVSREMMGRLGHSVQFYSFDGNCMFKVYLGRDENRAFLPGQEAAFAKLRDRMAAG